MTVVFSSPHRVGLALGAWRIPRAVRPSLLLLTALLAGMGLLAEAGPLRAEPKATTGDASNDLMLHRFGSGAHRLMFSGETDARAFPIFLTGTEARARAHIHITYTNAVSVMSEASRMRISVNDVVVSETPIASPAAEDPQTLDVDLPASLLEPGYNAVKFEVQQRHRVDCSIAATYELWTQIDPANSGLSFDGLTPEPIGDLAELPALAPAADGTVALRLVVPKGIDASGLERLMRVAESVALRGHFSHPVVEVVGAPVEKPGLDIVVGTTDDLKAANLTDVLPEEDQLVALRAGQTPGHSILVLSGQSSTDVDAAMASLVPAPGSESSFGTPAGLKAVALMGGRPVEGGSVLNLRDLGVSSQEFSGRLFRAGFDLLMPPDFYAADYGKMTLLIDAGYSSGLDKSSQILVRVNDRDAASLQLANRAGDVFRDRPITVPLSNLRPGFNHVEIEAELGNPADKSCDAAVLMSAKKRFVLLDDSAVKLPSIARIAHMPSLSATAGSGFPYVGRVAEGEIDLPHPDADTVGAAATFLARAAVAAGVQLTPNLVLSRNPSPKGSAIVFGAFADVPPGLIEAAGLDLSAMRSAWTHVEARSVATARLRDGRATGNQASGASLTDLAASNDHDGSVLYRKWSEDVSAGQWRIEPMRLLAEILQKSTGLSRDNLPHWGQAEDRYAVVPDTRLVMAQHEAPGTRGATLTLLLAPTSEALAASMQDLTGPWSWNQLDGRISAMDSHSPRLAVVPAVTDYFIPTATLSPGNLRLIAAGWLSSSIEIYVLIFVLMAIALGAATTATVKRYGIKP